jgi:hypothetical protein
VELATEIAAALGDREVRDGRPDPDYRVVAPQWAAFTSARCTLRARGGGQEHAVHLDLAGGHGWVTSEPPSAEPAPFAAREGVFGSHPFRERLQAGVPELLARLGLAADQGVEADDVPDLVFYLADRGGRTWRVTYAPATGSVRGVAADSPAARPPVQRFQKALHVSCGYTGWKGGAALWPVFVDVLALAMLFWVDSGLVMWWQIKAVRVSGLLVLLASGLTAAAVAASMYGALVP